MTTSESSDFFYSSFDGLKLYARIYGESSDAPPLICLPGLTRNGRDFHQLALFLSRESKTTRKVVCFDYRGRGRSAYDKEWKNYDVRIEARDIADGLTALGIEEAAFLGTSRGGLIIFLLAAMRPAAIEAVILNDVGPVIEGEGLAHIQANLKRAPTPATFDEAVEVQRIANGAAFPSLTDEDWHRFVRALYRDEDGRPVLDFDPALVNTVKDADFSKPLPVLWPQFEALAKVPVMAIRGANSRLLAAGTLAEMEKRRGGLVAVTVEGQGHAPLLETGDLPQRIAAFLAGAD